MAKTQKTRNVTKPTLMSQELFDFLSPLFLVDGEYEEVLQELEKAKLRAKDRLAGKTVADLTRLQVSETYAEIVVKALGGNTAKKAEDKSDESRSERSRRGGVQVQVTGNLHDHMLTLPVSELVEGLEPENPSSPSAAALKAKIRDANGDQERRCLVFTDEGTVDTKVTTKLANEVIKGQKERTTYQGPDDLVPRPVYFIGELPSELSIVRVCAAHGCEVRDDGECTADTGEHWTNIEEAAEHVIAIGREMNDGGILALTRDDHRLKQFLREVRGKGKDFVLAALTDISKNAVTIYGQRVRAKQPMPNLSRPRSELRNLQGAQGGGSQGPLGRTGQG